MLLRLFPAVRSRRAPGALAAALLSACAVAPAPTPRPVPRRAPTAPVDSALFAGMHFRLIGPSRGGRVTTVTGVPSQPYTFYMGSTGGGVWKTTDAGQTWRNVSDGWFAVASMGAIDVSLSDPRVVFAGTGSEAIRSNVSVGRGVYRSEDAGASWRFVGLRDVGQIGAVRIHPTDPDLVYVAAVGNPFAPSPERGIYRTRDGGRSWQRVLWLSDSTGAVDLELQPGNPSVLYASLWRAERKPWTIISGAREGGIYRSTDGGDTWTRLTEGLPTGLVGKSNVAVSAADPRRVYALIEAAPGGGLYRSDDAGDHWTLVSEKKELITRPFYYTNITADPTDADVVYVGTEGFYRSADGGRSWTEVGTPHGDNHDLWINPRDASLMIQSNDGGANVSLDGGRTWSTQYNQPTAEIYNVAVDSQVPYRVYGAQQDNTTVIVPSLPETSAPVDDPLQTWRNGPGCETGPILPHPTRPDTVYGSCKGQFSRLDLHTGQEKQYWVGGQYLYGQPTEALLYRFQRVSPMAISPFDAGTIYYGSQYVHRTRDEGVTWERISPDLTANDARHAKTVAGAPITIDVTGEEYYATLYALAESPIERGVIWAGSNDGPVHLTRDGGKTWADVTPKELPPGGRVQTIEPSPRRPGSAYVSVLRYLLGDFQPYVFRTDDYGATWTRLTTGTNGIPADDPVRVVREDPDRDGLLYAGTEFGLFISFDDGARWQRFQLDLPMTPVTDIAVHAMDLVLSTQGRAFWVLDDVARLHELGDGVLRAPSHLFSPRDAYRLRYASHFGGAEQDLGRADAPVYPPPGAMIDYWLATAPASATLELLDSRGALVRRFASGAAGRDSLPAGAGMHRFVWDLRYPGPWDADARRSGRNGPLVVPGRYTVRLTVDGVTTERPLVVRIDPRVARDGVTLADLRGQLAHNLRVRDAVSEVNRAVARIRAAERRLAGATGAAADTLARLRALEAKLVTPSVRYSRPQLQAQLSYLYGMTTQADQRIGRDAVERYQTLRRELDARLAELREILGGNG